MDTTFNSYLKEWTVETAKLPWGLQRVLHDALNLVAEEKISMAWGADVHAGVPCLMNAVSNMTQQGNRVPGEYAPAIVSIFDEINGRFHAEYEDIVKTDLNIVHPFCARALVTNFAPFKDAPTLAPLTTDFDTCDIVPNGEEDCLNSWVASSIINEEATNDSPSEV